MKNYFLLTLLFLCSCGGDFIRKIEEEVLAKESVEEVLGPADNFCQARYVTSFDNLGLVYTPISGKVSYSLQVSSDNARNQTQSFEKNAEPCKELYKLVTPYVFSDQRGMLKNDLSLSFDIDQALAKDLTPGREVLVNLTRAELSFRHQLVYFGSEKNANTVVRSGKVSGSISCPKPFLLSCDPSRKPNVCGPLKLTPPQAVCELSFSGAEAKLSQTQSLRGNFGGKLDFAVSHSDKKANLIVEQIESLTLVKDR